MRQRSSSKYIGDLVKKNEADIYVIHPNGEVYPVIDDDDPDSDIRESKLLGKGQQGSVYAVIISFIDENGQREYRLCALKTLQEAKKTRQNYHEKITAQDESSADCNIIKFMGTIDHNGEKFALLPYCELFSEQILKSLDTINAKNPTLRLPIILHIMTDLAFALQNMHARGYLHGDIKFENVAYHLGKFCLIDLDCSHPINEPVASLMGSPYFLHPACFSDKTYCSKPENDIYALGMMLKMLMKDKKTLDWIADWKIKENDLSKIQMLSEMSKEQSAHWEKSLSAQKMTNAPKSLATVLNAAASIEKKLEILANRMTNISLYGLQEKYQPDIDEILYHLEHLRLLLLEKHKSFLEEAEKELDDFYNAIIPDPPDLSRSVRTRHVSEPNTMTFFRRRSTVSTCTNEEDLLSISLISALTTGLSSEATSTESTPSTSRRSSFS